MVTLARDLAAELQHTQVPGQPDDDIEIINTSLASLRVRQPLYEKYRKYEDGDHNLRYATEKFRNVFGHLFKSFADNLCPVVIDAVNDKLVIRQFGVTDLVMESNPVSIKAYPAANPIWNKNRMDERAMKIQHEALLCGDSFVIVWPDDDGAITIFPNKPDLMTVEWDEQRPGKLLWATKTWYTMVDGLWRCNIYRRDTVKKYAQKNKGTDRTLPTAAGTFILVDEVPNPTGEVPVFHFANNARMNEYGRSELLNVIPLQDALNKSITDLLVSMEYVAMPQRWATGLQVPVDEETGEASSKPFTPGVDRVWSTPNEAARFGEFGQAKLSEFTQVQSDFRMAIARTSGTPFHYLQIVGTVFPTGEAMKTAESRFLAKVHSRQVSFGNVWEDVLRFSLKLADTEAPEGLTTVWKDPMPRSEKEFIETEEIKHRIGVPEEQLWSEMGYTDEQVGKMRTLRDKEVEREMSIEANARAKANQMAQTRGQQPREAGKGVTGETRDEVA